MISTRRRSCHVLHPIAGVDLPSRLPTDSAPFFMLGLDSAGHWVIREMTGDRAGLFRTREAAIKYARGERARGNFTIIDQPYRSSERHALGASKPLAYRGLKKRLAHWNPCDGSAKAAEAAPRILEPVDRGWVLALGIDHRSQLSVDLPGFVPLQYRGSRRWAMRSGLCPSLQQVPEFGIARRCRRPPGSWFPGPQNQAITSHMIEDGGNVSPAIALRVF